MEGCGVGFSPFGTTLEAICTVWILIFVFSSLIMVNGVDESESFEGSVLLTSLYYSLSDNSTPFI